MASADCAASRSRASGPAASCNDRTGRRTGSVAPEEPDELALDLHPVRTEDPGLVGGIGGFKGDRGAAPRPAFHRRPLVVDEGDVYVAGAGIVLEAEKVGAFLKDARLDHRIAADFEGEMLARRQHVRGNRYCVA